MNIREKRDQALKTNMKKVRQEKPEIREVKKEMQEEKDTNNEGLEIGEMVPGRIYRIYLARGKDSITGIFFSAGKEWLVFRYVPVDYQVDGYCIVRRSKIQGVVRSDEEKFKEQIFRVKKIGIGEMANLSLESDITLFNSFLELSLLLQIETHRNDIVYIGKVSKVYTKSVKILIMSKKTEWLKEESFRFAGVWIVSIRNNYLDSLLKYREYVDKTK